MTVENITDIPRDRYGRPMVTPPEGGKPVAYSRCTTFVDALEDKYQLQKWQQRQVAIGLHLRPDYLMEVAGIGDPSTPKGKSRLNTVCDKALEAAKGSAAATTGTALHALTERLDRGQDVGVVPAAYTADLAAYEAATVDLEAIHIEQFCVNDWLKVGGTPDRVVQYKGKRWIADLKTGSIEWGASKIAMQLAMYARSVPYDHATGQRLPPHGAETDKGVIIHLPAGTGTCELIWIDLTAGWEGVIEAKYVREWRARKLKDFRVDLTPSLADLVDACDTIQALNDLYLARRGEFDEALISRAAARKAALTNTPQPRKETQ